MDVSQVWEKILEIEMNYLSSRKMMKYVCPHCKNIIKLNIGRYKEKKDIQCPFCKRFFKKSDLNSYI